MRVFVAVAFVALTAPAALAAEPTDSDMAKTATVTLLKAMKAKDIDAVMKVVDVPFVLELNRPEVRTFDKPADLKAALKKLLDEVNADDVPTDLGPVYDMATLAKMAKSEGAEKYIEKVEKIVGKTGFMVRIKSKDGDDAFGVLVSIKDGKALIAATTK